MRLQLLRIDLPNLKEENIFYNYFDKSDIENTSFMSVYNLKATSKI